MLYNRARTKTTRLMFNLPVETYVRWVVWALAVGVLFSALAAAASFRESRRLPFFMLRRQALERGWRYVIFALTFIGCALTAQSLGANALRRMAAPTPGTESQGDAATPPPLLAASPTLTGAPTNTPAASPRPSLTPTITLTPTQTGTPTDTPTPTASPTPHLPLEFVTPIITSTITPDPEAVIGGLTMALNPFNLRGRSEYFDPSEKTLYAVFNYNNWRRGVQWSGVWYRNGQLIYIETWPWDGSTGGYSGFTSLHQDTWILGEYEVQIFIGDIWLDSVRFYVVEPEDFPTPTPRAPRPPTAAPSP